MQYGPKTVNVGVTLSCTVTCIVAAIAHCPTFGVNEYVVVPEAEVLIVAGLHVPVIPLMEVKESIPGVSLKQ